MPTPRAPLALTVATMIVLSAMALPLVYLSFRTVGVGFDALPLLLSKRTIIGLVNTILLAFLVTSISALIAVPLAFITVRTDIPGRKFFSVATALPLVIPSYVGSFVVISALGPRGSIVQNLLAPFGIEQLPSIYGWPGTVIVLSLFTYPYILLTVRSSLRNLDPRIDDASRTLGHSQKQTFFKVTLPHLRPSIAAGGLLVALYTMSDFGTPALMRFDSITRIIYLQYQSSFDRNLAAVLSLVLVAVAATILILEQRARRRIRYYNTSPGSRKNVQSVRLGKWRWPALLLCISITMAGLVLPIGTITFWLIRGLAAGESLLPVAQITFNSVYISSLAAGLIIATAFPVAVLAVRYPSTFSNLAERGTYLGFAMPGIVVALSLVFFGANYAPALYQTLPMLIFAYMVLLLPLAVGAIRSSLLQINPHIEEAGRSLGRTSQQTLRSVTVPLIRPGIIGAAALVFLTAMRELPATLLLAPIGFNTLATRIWSTTNDVFFAQAAAPALLLVAVSSISLFLILSQEDRYRGAANQ